MLIGENTRQREQSAQGTTSFLQSQLEDAKARLEQQDAKLAEFKSRYMGELPDESQMNLNVLTNLNSRFDAVTQSLDRAQANKAYAQMLLRQQLAAWEAQRAGNNPHPETLEQQLATLESELLSLRTRYTDDYPEVTKVQALIAGVQKKIAAANTVKSTPSKKTNEGSGAFEPPNVQQIRGEVHMYEQSIQEATREQQKLQQQISLYQSRVQLSPNVEQQYRQITRDYTNAVESYNGLLKSKDQSVMGTELELREQGEQFRTVDLASLPREPSYPKRIQFAGGGLGAGLALGLGLALLLEMRDKSLRRNKISSTTSTCPRSRSCPRLHGPRMKRGAGGRGEQGKSEMSVVCGAEEFRKLRSHLELLREQRRIRTVLISSSLAQEGKTFGAANLAQVMARQQERRVLAIDGDLRLPRLHLSLGAQLAPGLSDYLSGAADEFSIIQRGPVANLSFISGGNLAANRELIRNGRLKRCFRRYNPHRLDYFGLPAGGSGADARLLAEFCDTVLVRAGETPFDIARKHARAPRQIGVGVILNQVEPIYAYSSYYYAQV
jgi:Mrp family chromosome partitioning ATPase